MRLSAKKRHKNFFTPSFFAVIGKKKLSLRQIKLFDMDYISVKEYAEIHGLSERTVRNYCSQGIMQGAKHKKKTFFLQGNK